jgi:hypothetical protein
MKQKFKFLIFSVLFSAAISAQDKWDTDGNNNLPANNKLGSKNNSGVNIYTNNIKRGEFTKEGKFVFNGVVKADTLISDSLLINGGARIKGRLHVGQNSMWLGGVGGPFGVTDDLTSTNGNINLGGESPLPFSQIRIGIGTQNPNQMLHMHNSLTPSNLVRHQFTNANTTAGSGRGFLVGILANGNANFHQQELNRPITLTTNGGFSGVNSNFPIGTTFNPQSLFHINDGAAATNYQVTNNTTGVNAGDGLKLGILANGIGVLNQQENLDMQFHTFGSQRMVIKNAGRVGIGLNTPANRLEIVSGTGDPYFVSGNGSSGLKFANLNSGNTPIANPSGKVLALDNLGNVILVPDGGSSGPSGATAKNGLNVTFGPPDVELGGTLLHNTDVDQNTKNLVWKGYGQFGIGNGIPNASSFFSGSRFELNDNVYNSSMYIRNITPGGSVGLEMDILGSAVTNLGHRINIQGGQNNIGLDINAIGITGSTVNEGIVCYAKEGMITYGAVLVGQTSDPITIAGFGSVNQLDLNDPHYFSRRAGSGSIVIGNAIGTKYGAVATTHNNNNDGNVGFGGIIGVNGINTIDVCNGTTVKNIAVYGAFFDPTPFNLNSISKQPVTLPVILMDM